MNNQKQIMSRICCLFIQKVMFILYFTRF